MLLYICMKQKILGGNIMGTPTYRSTSYDGKGSTNRRGTIVNSVEDGVMVSRETRGANRKIKSPMVEMLELLEEVERCREVVADRQSELDSAKKDLERAEKKVSDQIDKLDPETKARFRRMMGGIGNQEPGDGNEER